MSYPKHAFWGYERFLIVHLKMQPPTFHPRPIPKGVDNMLLLITITAALIAIAVPVFSSRTKSLRNLFISFTACIVAICCQMTMQHQFVLANDIIALADTSAFTLKACITLAVLTALLNMMHLRKIQD